MCARVSVEHAFDVFGPDGRVHVAFAQPEVEMSTGDVLDVEAEEHVGQEQNLALGGNGAHDIDGVRRSAAVVALGLHGRVGVDVGDDDAVGMFRAPGTHLPGGNRDRERAPRQRIGKQDPSVG